MTWNGPYSADDYYSSAQPVGPRQPLDEKDAEIARLRTALSEIGASAAEALIRMGIEGFGDGGALGDSLISIKDTVDETFSKA